jgi:hypothetical protein
MVWPAPQKLLRTMLAGEQGCLRKVEMGVVGGCNHHLQKVYEPRLLDKSLDLTRSTSLSLRTALSEFTTLISEPHTSRATPLSVLSSTECRTNFPGSCDTLG